MKNVKAEIYRALQAGCPGADVSDEWPRDWAKLPKVTYTQEDNSVYEWTDNKEKSATVLFRVDVWGRRSTSSVVSQVDEALSALGMRRTYFADVPSGTDPAKHAQMRYQCIVDEDTDYVFHE